MNFPNFINVPTAIEGHSKLNLSSQHITTSDWMQFGVAKYVKMVPDQTIDVQHLCFQRLAPMPVPTFGRGQMIHRAYFVPFRTVWTAWDAFYNNTPHAFDEDVYTTPSNARYIYDSEIVEMFLDVSFSTEVGDVEQYDFEYSSLREDKTVISSSKHNFTSLGRFAYKLLRSLGISVTFVTIEGVSPKPVDAMKLLCVSKVYLDNFYPKQYSNTDDAIWMESLFNSNSSYFTWEESLSSTNLMRLIRCLYRVPYGSDYFTSAWDNPVGPNTGTIQKIELNDIGNAYSNSDSFKQHVSFNPAGAVSSKEPMLVGGDSGIYHNLQTLTKYSLTALQRVTDYVKRFQLVGSKIIDRFFARFGIKLSSEALRRSVRIAEYRDDIDFADVTSMASTEGASLGSYAGKGISIGRHGFSFTAKEHGLLLIISINVPEISYYQGMHRDSYHFTRLDYWNPEFDALGVQAISKSELYQPIDGKEIGTLLNDVNYQDSVFGFTPRYAEYKIPYSVISGDYLLRSKNVGNESWTLARDVLPFVQASQDDVEHSLSFVMSDDKAQYNRIFYNQEDTADHFNVIHDFNIMSVFPGKQLFEEYEFENEDKSDKVSVQLNGSVDAN